MTGIRGPAATGLGKQVRAAQARLVVPFEDNRHLNRLLGEYDGHLALLEDRLGIVAQARVIAQHSLPHQKEVPDE